MTQDLRVTGNRFPAGEGPPCEGSDAVYVPDVSGPLTRGSLHRVLFLLAGPAVVAKALHALLGLVDIFWVGRLGAAPTAAVNTSFFASWILESATHLTAVGILAYVSRSIGAGDRQRAGVAAAQGILLGVVLGIGIAAAAWFASPVLFHATSSDPQVTIPGITYLRTLFLAAPLTFLYVNGESIMRAAGNTRRPLVITGAMVLLNMLLDPLLIFGIGPFPRLEVFGAAVATVVAQFLAVCVFAVHAWRRHADFPLHTAALRRLQSRFVIDFLRLGAPALSIGVLFSSVYLFLSGVAARMGTVELALLGLGNRVETLTYLGTSGFAEATGAVVGQNLGAGRIDRAARAAWWSAGYMMVYGSLVGVLMVFFPRQLLHVFTDDPRVLEVGAQYVRILGICQGLMGVEIVLERAFAGAGDPLPPMLVSVPINVLRIPVVLWVVLPLEGGIIGVGILLSATSGLRGLLSAWWFSRGRWKQRQLRA
jgi:putative MATE family efflux protein